MQNMSRRKQGRIRYSRNQQRIHAGSSNNALHPHVQRVQEHSAVTQEDNYWGKLASGTEDEWAYRRLSDQWYQKDLLPSTYLEIHNQVFEAYNANPLAYAIIEQTTSFVLGEGVIVSAANKKVQAVIDAFWYHPENRMDDRIYSLCMELALYGEQFIHFFVNKFDGTVIIRQIDPSLIDQIETDPEDIEKPLRYHRRPIGQVMTSNAGDPPPSIVQMRPGEETQGCWFKAREEVVQIAINKVSNAKRGKSDLATLLPWLRRYKDWLTDRVRLNKYRTAFLWDVQLTGADKKTIDRKRMEYSAPPEPGSVIIHNEAEKWTAVSANLNSQDAAADGRAIKLMVATGATLPEHWLSDGDNGNRATASEMSLPTLLKFKRRQRVMRFMLEQILDRVIEEAKRVGKIPKTANTAYTIDFPEIDSSEHGVLAHAVSMIMPALTTAKENGWISDETAMKLLFEFCGEEIDIYEEKAKVTAQMQSQMQAVLDGKMPLMTDPATKMPPMTTPVTKTPPDTKPPPKAKPLRGKNGYGHKLNPFVTYDGGFR